jgi:tyrosyl-tRNA synthetase
MTSPYKFYQFWINIDDADLPKFTRYFTLRSQDEIEAREAELVNNKPEQKRLLAEELTVRIHSQAAYESVLKVSELLFGRNADRDMVLGLDEDELEMIASEIPSYRVSKDLLDTLMRVS